jgi:hypothetical protein
MDLHWYQTLNEWFPDRDQSYVPIWGASYSNYSDFGWVVILDRDGQLYECSFSYHPEGNTEAEWSPTPVTYERAMEILENWEEFLDD